MKPEALTLARRRALRSQMTTLERDVLDELCQTKVTRNAVVLTLDLTNRRRLLRFGDPYGLVETCLIKLNGMGLITYFVGDRDVPVAIRTTDLGFHAAGYSLTFHEASREVPFGNRYRRDDASVRHPGDRTDFRTQHHVTTGGPVERMPLPEHLVKYPDHVSIHPTIAELRGEVRFMNDVITRKPGKPWPPEMRAKIAELLRDGKPNEAILRETGLKDRTLIAEIGREIGIFRGSRGRLLTADEAAEKKARQIGTGVGHKLDADAVREMIRQYLADESLTLEALSHVFGVTPQGVRYHLKRAGVTIRRPGTPAPRPRQPIPPVRERADEADRKASFKATLFRIIAANGEFREAADLFAALTPEEKVRYKSDFHTIAHELYALLKQGLIKFIEVKTSPKHKKYTRIRATEQGRILARSADAIVKLATKDEDVATSAVGDVARSFNANGRLKRPVPRQPKDATDFRTQSQVAIGGPIERSRVEPVAVVSAPQPEPEAASDAWAELPQLMADKMKPAAPAGDRWPILAELQAKEADRLKAQAKAERYLQAAALLEDPASETDKLMVDSLIAAADAIAEKHQLSRVEAEYLAFARETTSRSAS